MSEETDNAISFEVAESYKPELTARQSSVISNFAADDDEEFEYLECPELDEDFLDESFAGTDFETVLPRKPYMSVHAKSSSFDSYDQRCFMPGRKIRVNITDVQVDPHKLLNPHRYVVELTHGDYHWTIMRRYKHFRHLQDQLLLHRAKLKFSVPTSRQRKQSSALRKRKHTYPRFPRSFEIHLEPEEVEEKKKQLQDYLQSILRFAELRNHPETLKFLDVSRYSFINGLGKKWREGYIKKRSGGRRISLGCCSCIGRCGSSTRQCAAHWGNRWLMLKDTFVAYVHPREGTVRDVLLMDRDFRVEHGVKGTGKKNCMLISNLTRHLLLKCWTKRKTEGWSNELKHIVNTSGLDFTQENRYNSFVPPRDQTHASWFVDGSHYMSSVADALEAAREEIFITDWWLSPELYLKRPMTEGEKWRLDEILKRKADQGVKIFILLYKEMEMALGINSFYTKQTLLKLNPENVRVLRHPDGISLWSHHEKVVVIDQKTAYLGGFDLCYGRWDTPSHRLTDLGSVQSSSNLASPKGPAPTIASALTKMFPVAASTQLTDFRRSMSDDPGGASRRSRKPNVNIPSIIVETVDDESFDVVQSSTPDFDRKDANANNILQPSLQCDVTSIPSRETGSTASLVSNPSAPLLSRSQDTDNHSDSTAQSPSGLSTTHSSPAKLSSVSNKDMSQQNEINDLKEGMPQNELNGSRTNSLSGKTKTVKNSKRAAKQRKTGLDSVHHTKLDAGGDGNVRLTLYRRTSSSDDSTDLKITNISDTEAKTEIDASANKEDTRRTSKLSEQKIKARNNKSVQISQNGHQGENSSERGHQSNSILNTDEDIILKPNIDNNISLENAINAGKTDSELSSEDVFLSESLSTSGQADAVNEDGDCPADAVNEDGADAEEQPAQPTRIKGLFVKKVTEIMELNSFVDYIRSIREKPDEETEKDEVDDETADINSPEESYAMAFGLSRQQSKHDKRPAALDLRKISAVNKVQTSGPTAEEILFSASKMQTPEDSKFLEPMITSLKPSTPKPRKKIAQKAFDFKEDVRDRFLRAGSRSVDFGGLSAMADGEIHPEAPESPEQYLCELGLQGSSKIWIGKDYSNFINKDFVDLDYPFTDFIDRTETPRMPWHDVGVVVYGKAARDVARHFIQRWNFSKLQKRKTNKHYPMLMPKSYNRVINPPHVIDDTYRCKCQILRSSSVWSAGIKTTEASIHEAYLGVIKAAKHYIYIENQFFVSIAGHSTVENQITQALFTRIMEAHSKQETFRVYVVLPLLPAFEGELGTSSGAAIQAVTRWNYNSISRGGKSLLEKLVKAGVIDPFQYISFFGLRQHDTLLGKMITELIYVHSKMLIADDNTAIIGSANINDRSMLGKRDSEIAVLVEDTQTFPSMMNGRPYRAGKFAGNLRKTLFREHLGIDEDDKEVDLSDPVCSDFYKQIWLNQAAINTSVYEKVFRCMPTDEVRDFHQLHEYQSSLGPPKMAETDPSRARQELKMVKGYLVLFPLQFLCQEKLEAEVGTKEALVPNIIWT